MGVQLAASFLHNKQKARLFRECWQAEKSESGGPSLDELLVAHVGPDERDISYVRNDVENCRTLFRIIKGFCKLTHLAKKIAKLCDDYALWGKMASCDMISGPDRGYLERRVNLSALGFTWSGLGGYNTGQQREQLLRNGWVTLGAGGTLDFTKAGLAYKIILAMLFAATTTKRTERAYYSFLKEALYELKDENETGLVLKIKRIKYQLYLLEDEEVRAELVSCIRKWKESMKGVPKSKHDDLEWAVFGHYYTIPE